MREGDYGLFVTLSNYTKNAKKYLESTPIIRGINGTELVDLILKYYDDLDDKYQKMIPLKMVSSRFRRKIEILPGGLDMICRAFFVCRVVKI